MSKIPHLDNSLRSIVTKAGEIAKDPLAGGDARSLAIAVGVLATLCGEHEARIRAPESCEGDLPHVWDGSIGVGKCKRCKVPR